MGMYYFSGQENYLKKQELKKAAAQIDNPELNYLELTELTPGLYDFLSTSPFMGRKKICVLHFFPDTDEFVRVAKSLPDFVDLYIVTSGYPDQRKKAVKELLGLMKKKEFGKIDEPLLYRCIASRLTRFGYTTAQIEAAKSELLRAFRAYSMHADMDLDMVQKHVEMIALSGSLTAEHIRAFAPDSSDYRAYRLSTMLLDKDEACLDFARSLIEQGEVPIGILSLVAFQIRICYKAVLLCEDESYLNKIGIRNYQLYSKFNEYSAMKYVNVYTILMGGIQRVKKGEETSGVLTDCLSESLAILRAN